MNLVLWPAFLLFFAASGPASVQVMFSPLTKTAYLAAKPMRIVTKPYVTYPIKKTGGRIVISVAKGQSVFQDKARDEDDSDQVHYEYRGYLPQIGCHLLRVAYYETEEWLLINYAGQQIHLWSEPAFSPDMQYAVTMCMGIEYGGGQPNIIQLLQLKKGSVREIWSIRPKQWEPYRIGWLSSNTLLLSKEMWTGKNPGNWFTYSKLLVKQSK